MGFREPVAALSLRRVVNIHSLSFVLAKSDVVRVMRRRSLHLLDRAVQAQATTQHPFSSTHGAFFRQRRRKEGKREKRPDSR